MGWTRNHRGLSYSMAMGGEEYIIELNGRREGVAYHIAPDRSRRKLKRGSLEERRVFKEMGRREDGPRVFRWFWKLTAPWR